MTNNYMPQPILKFTAFSLGELNDCVDDAIKILRYYAGSENTPDEFTKRRAYPIWYRGQASSSYNMLPSLFRTGDYDYTKPFSPCTYLEAKTMERDRIQQFSSRAYHKIDVKPQSSIEWLEVMQHYQVNTRLMDWSENLYTSTMFALESYMSNPRDLRWGVDNRQSSPSVWLLSPVKLNEIVFNTIIDRRIIDCALKHLFEQRPIDARQMKLLKKLAKEYIDHKSPDFRVVSLSRLTDIRHQVALRLPDVFFNGELNPLLYLLLRIYDDGVQLPVPVPPLAITNPYHSQRIETQRGVFTIYPHPAKYSNKCQVDSQPVTSDIVQALDDFPASGTFMCEIRLANPQGIANELRRAGYDRTFLYPDLTEYGQAVEWR